MKLFTVFIIAISLFSCDMPSWEELSDTSNIMDIEVRNNSVLFNVSFTMIDITDNTEVRISSPLWGHNWKNIQPGKIAIIRATGLVKDRSYKIIISDRFETWHKTIKNDGRNLLIKYDGLSVLISFV